MQSYKFNLLFEKISFLDKSSKLNDGSLELEWKKWFEKFEYSTWLEVFLLWQITLNIWLRQCVVNAAENFSTHNFSLKNLFLSSTQYI